MSVAAHSDTGPRFVIRKCHFYITFGLPNVVDLGWTNSLKTDLIELDLCNVWASSNCTKGGWSWPRLKVSVQNNRRYSFDKVSGFMQIHNFEVFIYFVKHYIIIVYPTKKRIPYHVY